MCTGFSFFTKKKHHYLARTMDFAFEFNGIPTVVPRHYNYQFDLESEMRLEYGFVGTNLKVGRYRFGDGINEQGVAISNHYFTGEASYSSHRRYGYLNLAPEEFIVWVLGFIKNVDELKQKVKTINIMNEKNTTLNVVPPLHFIITDNSGHTVAVEPHNGLLIVKDNHVKVLTNAPKLEWHVENLRNYAFLQPEKSANQLVGKVLVRSMGCEAGTNGLPGGYTSTERFVRATYLRHHLQSADDEDINLMNCFKILDSVSIPQGAVLDAGETHYTQYQLVMDSKDKTYYIKPYFSNQLFKVQLTEEVLTKDEMTFLPINSKLMMSELNG
ncbi:choloylglycine hydrolase family protein [Staphylococcus caprae]|uniref:Penicillin V acylase n=3 Tax=Staphylococcus TaxID=1279 RepID=A0ABM7FRL3_9STAP|nr:MULTISPECIES: choloylglycine hydrolase family protein [Staphylococcus]EES41077.1 linear amide C-N hydrolase, choloylglycine hydrolase family protein [Staphylococcus caprae M23864:W1]MBN6827091.1 choloylglycine hydrolase family protein [Staphylococcus caprae]MBX5316617.1 choloylglycine hydrolase family protein [Staphylococcus caprae]MBX5322023.1 choloylglycine hydrolase family protein [Staphylococcus caprae]MCR6089800.1 choloylglycine hydrolase family protein [Staphylococcus aureus]